MSGRIKFSRGGVLSFVAGTIVATLLTTLFFRSQFRKSEASALWMSEARTQVDLLYLTGIAREVSKEPEDFDRKQLNFHLITSLKIALGYAENAERHAAVVRGLDLFGEMESLLEPNLIEAAKETVKRLESEGGNG